MGEQVKVGFVGLGVMGKPMARNLMKAGFALTVHNRSRGAVEELAAEGARRAFSPAEVARASEFVVTCLPGPADVDLVYLGPDGILSGAQPGSVLIDMSTIDPGTHAKIAAAAAGRGIGYLDAPVSGGPAGAQSATLTIMVGGDAATLERARPVLGAMGQRIYHMGPVGAGAATKLINNLMAAVNAAGMAEGMVMAVKFGLDPALFAEVVGNSSGASRMFSSLVPEILKRNFEPGFAIDLHYKDARLACDLAGLLGVRLLLGSLATQVLQEARGAGLGKKAIDAQIIPLERIAGVEVKGGQAE